MTDDQRRSVYIITIAGVLVIAAVRADGRCVA